MLVFCKFLEEMSLQSKEVVVHLGQELGRYVFPVGVGQDGVDAAVWAEDCVRMAELDCGFFYFRGGEGPAAVEAAA